MKSVKNKSVSDKTLKKYIDYLSDAFLISQAKRYDIKGKRYIGAPSKYYFEDVGLRNARLNFRQVEPTHIMENIIYNELRIRGYGVDVGVVEHYETGSDGARHKKQVEVDFVAVKGSEKLHSVRVCHEHARQGGAGTAAAGGNTRQLPQNNYRGGQHKAAAGRHRHRHSRSALVSAGRKQPERVSSPLPFASAA